MGSVTKGRVPRVLALAEESIPVFLGGEGFRGEACPLVRAVAPGLVGGMAAGAIVISFPGFEDDFAGRGGGDLWFGHGEKMAARQGMGKGKIARGWVYPGLISHRRDRVRRVGW